MTLISTRDSGHDSIVKFSPSVCVAVVASFTWLQEVLATMLMEQQTVTNPAVIHDLCAMIKSTMHARSGSPPNDKSSY